MTAVSPMHADLILAVRESGATDDDLRELVVEAIDDAYFTEFCSRTQRLRADFTRVRTIDIEF